MRQTPRCKPGDIIQLYSGQRTAQCKFLGLAICSEVYPVIIFPTGYLLEKEDGEWGELISDDKKEVFAKADGFNSWFDMISFFSGNYDIPVTLWVHRWEDFKRGDMVNVGDFVKIKRGAERFWCEVEEIYQGGKIKVRVDNHTIEKESPKLNDNLFINLLDILEVNSEKAN